jgi:hypothetical protein
MDQLTRTIIDALHAHPMLSVGVAVGVVGLYFLLQRKPRIQRDADSRLAALRREKAERDGKSRH